MSWPAKVLIIPDDTVCLLWYCLCNWWNWSFLYGFKKVRLLILIFWFNSVMRSFCPRTLFNVKNYPNTNPMYVKGAGLGNCFGFIDGVVWPMYRPTNNQIILFYGHKHIHILKFQSCSKRFLQIFMLQLKGEDIIVLS